MYDVFFRVCLQRFQQLHADQNQQEITKDLQQALHWNEPPRGLPNFLRNQKPKVCRRQYHDNDEHNDHRINCKFLNL